MHRARIRPVSFVLVLAVLAGACSSPIHDPTYWQSDEFTETMPNDPRLAYPLHLRTAVVQEYGAGTWVDDVTDDVLLELLDGWCAEGATGRSEALRRGLDAGGYDNNPGRNFFPPLPIDELMLVIAGRYQPELCDASRG